MNIIELKEKETIIENVKTSRVFLEFRKLLNELEKKDLPNNIIESVNQDIDEINSTSFTDKDLRKLVKQKQMKILKLLEKEMKVVPKNHYRNLWLAVGMSAIGVPIGLVFGLCLGNIGLLGTGLPIGMAIGMVFGSNMDNKAFKEGRQLDMEVLI